MKRKLCLVTMLLFVARGLAFAATNDITELVRQGLFEEEANHNLDAAMKSYQTAIAGFDQDRPLAATAIFRLGECERKLGHTNEANAQYARILREFPDQSQLADLSRQYLPENQIAASAPPTRTEMTSEEHDELLKVQQMIRTSPDLINGGYGTGDSPLIEAIEKAWVHVVRFLLDSGANPNHQSGGFLPICKAADVGNEQIVEMLLERGADVNGRNTSGKTALFYAARDGFPTIARTLLAHHADTSLENHMEDSYLPRGATPLIAAAASGDPSLAELLIANGASVSVLDGNGETPLFTSVRKSRPETAKVFLAHGSDVNATNKSGQTPLFLAVLDSDLPVTQLLLSNGATVNLRDSKGATPLHLADSSEEIQIAELLLKNGANVNATNASGQTPLFDAVQRGRTAIVRLLLSNGADVNAVDNTESSPIGFAAGNDEIKNLLREHGANDDSLRRNGIFVTPKGSGSLGDRVFSKKKDFSEDHSLLDLIAWTYGLRWGSRPVFGTTPGFPPRRRSGAADDHSFPDLAHVLIHRLNSDRDDQLEINLQQILDSNDCSKNISLQWGDVVEIPEVDHPLNQGWSGLSQDSVHMMQQCLGRKVQIVIKGQTNDIKLEPEMYGPYFSQRGQNHDVNDSKSIHANDLNLVVRQCNLLLLSSDLTRVQVLRAGGPPCKFNLEAQPAPEFILQDGDVIEIPEK